MGGFYTMKVLLLNVLTKKLKQNAFKLCMISQQTFTCSNSTIETLENSYKYAQS